MSVSAEEKPFAVGHRALFFRGAAESGQFAGGAAQRINVRCKSTHKTIPIQIIDAQSSIDFIYNYNDTIFPHRFICYHPSKLHDLKRDNAHHHQARHAESDTARHNPTNQAAPR